ncbi:hypothetical protein [Bdellovibrio bacteriovorus]|uniref:hypothetical protein n=1 Tax=Bdellovibrio bacteriovorus TaxID=959 RepID=UPI003CFDB380
MRSMKAALLFLCTFASALVFMPEKGYATSTEAEELAACSSRDVRENMSPELKKYFMTPSDQGNIGWCYGYAANDILSQKMGAPLSAIYTSSYYTSRITGAGRFFRSILHGDTAVAEGGFIAGALKDIKKNGYACSTRALPQNGTFNFELVPNYVSMAGTGDLVRYMEKLRNNEPCDEMCERRTDYLFDYFFGKLNVIDVKRYIINSKSSRLEDVLFKLMDSGCGSSKIAVSGSLKIRTGGDTSKSGPKSNDRYGSEPQFDPEQTLLAKLNRQLNQNKVVGFEYNAKYVTGVGGIFGGWHASSVVGRKVINNKCHYLVRNSWGTTCSYKPGIICDKETGSYWVDSKTFKRMTSKLVWVD